MQRNIYFVRSRERRQRSKQTNLTQPWTSVQMSGGMRDCTVETVPTLNELFFQKGGRQLRYRPNPAEVRRRKKKVPQTAWKEYHCRGQGQPGQTCKYDNRRYCSDYDISWKEKLTENNPMKEFRKPRFNPDGTIISYYNQRRTDMRPKSSTMRRNKSGWTNTSMSGPSSSQMQQTMSDAGMNMAMSDVKTAWD